MLKLDHITVIAPSLAEGVLHVRNCLDLDVPFGQRHAYMGTHNHLLQLGDTVYLEIVALDPEADAPGRPRWFGLDDRDQVRSDWDEGRRLRGWVARLGSTRSSPAGATSSAPRFRFPLPILRSTSPFRTTAPSRSTVQLPRSSTGAASRARWLR
ncbi:VOC family protein [Bradyrhizobium symbiodeficiens]|uniref:VOC family protein n=1 Tax=Bradyrhizobium symbiodeficiens TaxID=1404367 RepID=UPI003BAEB4CD